MGAFNDLMVMRWMDGPVVTAVMRVDWRVVWKANALVVRSVGLYKITLLSYKTKRQTRSQ